MDRFNLFSLGAGACALILFFIIISAHESATVRFYADALKQYDISTNVSVDGRTLSVQSGEVTEQGEEVDGKDLLTALQMSYARTLAERSPLFALPGTSPSDLSYAISGLRNTAERLAELQKDPVIAEKIRTSLYPLDSLSAASFAEKARIDFLEHTDREHKIIYEQAVRNVSQIFLDDLRNFKSSVLTIVPETAKPYVAADRVVSKGNILSTLERIESGARMTIRILNMRSLCLKGFVSHCRIQDLSLPYVPEQNSVSIDPASVNRALDVKRFYAETTNYGAISDEPLVLLSNSKCTGDIPSPSLFVVHKQTTSMGIPPQFRVVFVGDIRYIPIDEYGGLPFYEDLHTQGIQYVLSPPLLHYECMDEGRDITAALSTRMVLNTSTSTVLSESDAIRAANTLVHARDPEGINIALAIKYHSAQFDQILRDVTWSESKNLSLLTDGIRPDLDAYNLFFSRSGFISLFAADNPSYVGDISLFPAASIPVVQQPYRYLSQVHSAKVENKILQDVGTYIRLHMRDTLQ